MRLSEVPATANKPKSKVDLLPDDVRGQLIDAYETASHSMSQMLWWLHNDDELPDVCRDVTRKALEQWFIRRGFRHASR